jgi:phosphohistidine phosphatase
LFVDCYCIFTKKNASMKKLTLIRHAKSSWIDYGLRDHDRPLAERGIRDAPFMAQLLASRAWLPDALVSSTALRARTTAGYFAAALGWEPAAIQLEKRIYEASVPAVLDFIAQLPAK